MLRFLFQVLIAAVFGGCIVWFGLPLLKEYQPTVYARATRIFPSSGKVKTSVSDAVKHLETQIQTRVSDTMNRGGVVEAETTGLTATGQAVTPAPLSEAGVNPEKEDHAAEEQASALRPALESSRPEEEPEPDDPHAALNKDPGYGWGIVVTNSYVYDAGMRPIGIFSGGTIVSRKQSKIEPEGYVAECLYLKDRVWVYEPVYIYEADLVLFDVTYDQADTEQRDLLVAYCRTLAEYEEERARAYKTAIRRNPHFSAYKTSMETYNAFVAKAKAAKQAMEDATGMRRSELINELRTYKAEEAAIIRGLKETKARYDAWKAEHIGDEKTPKVARTVKLQNLENRLNAMRPRVQQIVPGL